MKYRRKCYEEVEAIQWDGENLAEFIRFTRPGESVCAVISASARGLTFRVASETHLIQFGDWLTRDPSGQVCLVSREHFEQSHTSAEIVPIPALLYCPFCREQHVDEGEWVEHPHHTHLCASCARTWRVEPYCYGLLAVPVPEENRQTILLALAELSLRRPGWLQHLQETAQLFFGEKMFEGFRETSAVTAEPKQACSYCGSTAGFHGGSCVACRRDHVTGQSDPQTGPT